MTTFATKEEMLTPVDGGDGILSIRASGTTRAWNNIEYKTGLSAKNVGAKKLSMNVATVSGQRSQLWYHLPAGETFDLLARRYESGNLLAGRQ